MKKLICLLLSLMMVLTICPVSALAEGPEDTPASIETKATGEETPGKTEGELEADPEKEKDPETPETPVIDVE